MTVPLELGKICEECNKPCQPLPCSSRVESSEFYCRGCHKSHRMSIEVAKYILGLETQSRGK